MPEPSDDLLTRLRAEADRLDAAAPPVSSTDAGSTTPTPTSRSRWLPAAAVFVVLAGIGATWLLLSGDDDEEQLIVPADPPSTTTTTSTSLVDALFDVPIGIAVVPTEGPVRVLDLDGTQLGSVPAPVEALNGPELMLTEPPTPIDPIDPAEVPPGCTSAFGGGGVRVALCGGDPQRPTQVDVVDVTGSRITLHQEPLDLEAPTGVRAGAWRWALPSPDGQWVLSQWSGECEVPEAFLISLAFDDRPIDLAPVPPWTTSRGLGWTEDGRAIIQLPHSNCGTTAEQPGVYLLDPDSRELTLVVELDQGERAYVWRTPDAMSPIARLLTRATTELDLEYVLIPDGAAPVASFEGHAIDVSGSAESAEVPDGQTLPLLHGEATLLDEPADTILSFVCGDDRTWSLTWRDGEPREVDSMLLLAEMLVPHLYCTLPPR
jgi:hypothetical protein